MGRVITGRGNVFSYKEGETTRLARELKPYDFSRVMTNLQRASALQKDIGKSTLFASGSPLIAGPRAAYGLVREGAEALGRKLGVVDPQEPSEREKLEAYLSRGRASGLIPQQEKKAPVQAPAQPPQDQPVGGAPVAAPPIMAGLPAGTPLNVDLETEEVIRPEGASPFDMNDVPMLQRNLEALNQALAQATSKGADLTKIQVLKKNIKETEKALAPFQSAPSMAVSPVAPSAPATSPASQQAYQQQLLGTPPGAPAPQATAPAPAPQATAPTPAPGMTREQAMGIGPETGALYNYLDDMAATQHRLKTLAYQAQQKPAVTPMDKQRSVGLTGANLLANPAFNLKLRQVAEAVGADPQALVNVMNAESSLDPTSKNTARPENTASGLIQFIEKTAAEYGVTTAEIRAMNPVDQLDLVQRYLLRQKEKNPRIDYSIPGHLGQAIRHPATAGTGIVFDRNTGPEKYEANKAMDMPPYGNQDGVVTAAESAKFDARKAPQLPPAPATKPVGTMPVRQQVTAQDLQTRMQQIDAGSLVIPGVRPRQASFNNVLIMARNAKNDAQKNWVRQLVLEDKKLPWKSFDDLFSGAYKERAVKAIEDAFPKEEEGVSALDQSKIDLNKARITSLQTPKVKVPAAPRRTSRASKAAMSPVWTKWDKTITREEDDLHDQRKALVLAMTKLQSDDPRFLAGELKLPVRRDMESDSEFKDRVEWFKNTQQEVADARDPEKREALLSRYVTDLAKLDTRIENLSRIYSNAKVLMESSPDKVPRAFIDRYNTYRSGAAFGSEVPDTLSRVYGSSRKKPKQKEQATSSTPGFINGRKTRGMTLEPEN